MTLAVAPRETGPIAAFKLVSKLFPPRPAPPMWPVWVARGTAAAAPRAQGLTPGWRPGYGDNHLYFFNTCLMYSTGRTRRDAPASVVNFRNMQRRRGGVFRTDVRMPRRKNTAVPSLREHMFRTSHAVAGLAARSDAMDAFKEADNLLRKRMSEWHALASRVRAHDRHADHVNPQMAAAAWNQVIVLAVRANSPSAAWRVYCDMKRSHVRPTARTYAGFFHALACMVRERRIDLSASNAWLEHIDKLYAGLEQLHNDVATGESFVKEHVRPATRDAHRRLLQDVQKNPKALVAGYAAYISLLCALGHPKKALAVFNSVCPDGYPAHRSVEGRVPREHFATAQFYTAMLRDLGTCRMPIRDKQAVVRDLWRRWQFDILVALRNNKSPPLDAVALKTLVWTLTLGSPPSAVRDVCALLGSYMGVHFRRTPGTVSHESALGMRPIRFTDPALLVDVLAFFDRTGAYGHVADVYDFALAARHRALDPANVPAAVKLAKKAHQHLRSDTRQPPEPSSS